MKKLKDFKGQKIAVNCTTQEQAEAFCKLMHDNGFKWVGGASYLEYTNWKVYKQNTCYGFNKGEYSDLKCCTEEGYTILPATNFLEEEFIYGQEYEFSDNGDFKPKSTRQFVAKSTCGKFFITWSKNTSSSSYYKYARKINTERSEAITTAKELIDKFDIKQEELFND